MKALVAAALKDWQDIRLKIQALEKENDQKSGQLDSVQKEMTFLKSNIQEIKSTNSSLQTELSVLRSKIEDKEEAIRKLTTTVNRYESMEEQRKASHQTEIDKLMQSRESFEEDKARIADERVEEERRKHEEMKRTWMVHEETVKQEITNICKQHVIQYLDDVPFHGRPDNAIEICEEIIVFDAKSPANDDLTNFPRYIRNQAEACKKYASKEGVRREIYLVVPSNTSHVIKDWTHYFGEYTVYVLTSDALEPVILSLKRLEDYEFADQLSPEDRESLIRIIARFAHSTKRKIQVDQFFADQFLDLLKKCEKELPKDFKEGVLEFEKREKLNPPQEKRAKRIDVEELEQTHFETNAEAGIRKIDIPGNTEDARRMI
jgi:hypothetical protein